MSLINECKGATDTFLTSLFRHTCFFLKPHPFPPSATDRLTLSACRSWLHQLQTFVMALHRDIATITSISTSDKEATEKLWGLFGHDASTLLQLVISAVPADLGEPQQRDAGKQQYDSHSSCSTEEEEHVVQAVLHLQDSCIAGCAVQSEVSQICHTSCLCPHRTQHRYVRQPDSHANTSMIICKGKDTEANANTTSLIVMFLSLSNTPERLLRTLASSVVDAAVQQTNLTTNKLNY